MSVATVRLVPEPRLRLQHSGLFGVHGDGVKGHAAPVHAPLVHMRAIELRGDARFKDALVLGSGNALTVVEDGEQARVAGLLGGEEDATGAGVAALRRSSMTTSSLERMSWAAWRRSASEDRETDEAVSEVVLDPGDGSRRTHRL